MKLSLDSNAKVLKAARFADQMFGQQPSSHFQSNAAKGKKVKAASLVGKKDAVKSFKVRGGVVKKRGRLHNDEEEVDEEEEVEEVEVEELKEEESRGLKQSRGRPLKSSKAPPPVAAEKSVVKRGRGRPLKSSLNQLKSKSQGHPITSPKRQRIGEDGRKEEDLDEENDEEDVDVDRIANALGLDDDNEDDQDKQQRIVGLPSSVTLAAAAAAAAAAVGSNPSGHIEPKASFPWTLVGGVLRVRGLPSAADKGAKDVVSGLQIRTVC